MGFHVKLYSIKSFSKEKGIITFKDPEAEVYSVDCDMERCQHVFWDASFLKKDIVEAYDPDGDDWTTHGFLSTKSSMITNFTKFFSSKTNPFRDLEYAQDAAKEYIKLISKIKGRQVYYPIGHMIYHSILGNENERKQLKIIYEICKFYEEIRQKKMPSLSLSKSAFSNTFFKLQQDKKIKIDLDVQDKFELLQLLFGNV